MPDYLERNRMFTDLILFAQGQWGEGGSPWQALFPLVLIVPLFYFRMIRPKHIDHFTILP